MGQMDDLKFVVGLGNPGTKYAGTRHNAGFMVLEELLGRWSPGRPKEAFSGLVWDARFGGRRQAPMPVLPDQRVIMLAPQTYMNRSGLAVAAMMAFYKATSSQLLVVLDDMALPVGMVRARAGGSAGGHNGLLDIVAALGGQQVQRLRVGIGERPPMMEGADYVLSAFTPAELSLLKESLVQAADAVEDWVFGGIGMVMEKYNRRIESDNDPAADS
jgi:PTH1 family peptidyl-tRNA hydrolase